jgi:RNA polymerase sigma-70 factor, ECF subfamily
MVTWDQKIIQQVLDGDCDAYGRLVLEYQDPIRYSMTRILHDRESARDITQDAFLAAFEHLDTYDSSHSFFSWLYRIAWNRAINLERRERRLRPLHDRDFPSTEISAEDRLLAAERQASINRAIRHLPHKYMILLILRHYLDCSYRDIAAILDLPYTTVRSRIHTARRLMAEQLR